MTEQSILAEDAVQYMLVMADYDCAMRVFYTGLVLICHFTPMIAIRAVRT